MASSPRGGEVSRATLFPVLNVISEEKLSKKGRGWKLFTLRGCLDQSDP